MKISSIRKINMGPGYNKTLVCVVNPQDNSGEHVTIETDVYDGDFKAITISASAHGTSSVSLTFYQAEAFLKACHLLYKTLQEEQF